MPPATPAELPVLRLKKNEDRRLASGHLWVFSNEVDSAQTPLPRFQPGALVRVLAHNDRGLGLAYVNPQSLICARLLQSNEMPTTAWFERRLRAALALRERLYADRCYRWVYGESDALPGLVIDRFGDDCVVQLTTAGMQRLWPMILEALQRVVAPARVLLKNDGALRALEGLPREVSWAIGAGAEPATVVENGLRYRVALESGQKTGWFFDQADNRRRLSSYVRAGARVLDVFSYAGAWGISAMRLGAAQALCVDASAAALEAASANAALNGVALQTRMGDAFEVLEALAAEGARFDVAVVDPPAFAKRRKDTVTALAAYRRINQLAMRLLVPEGILVACSCSWHVSAEDFQSAVAKAARGSGRSLQILEYGGQSADHPVHPAIAETRYLKALFCRVNEALS
ncbi:MAG: class I SAM-dependent rRNA methyltransferase [Steroidobacteraceae bacterium]